jgi:hypothetical protein
VARCRAQQQLQAQLQEPLPSNVGQELEGAASVLGMGEVEAWLGTVSGRKGVADLGAQRRQQL